MSHAGEYHGKPCLVRRLDYLVVAHRAAGLNDSLCPCLGRSQKAIGEEEEGVRSHDRTFGKLGVEAKVIRHAFRLQSGNGGTVDPAHLPRANTHGGHIAHVDDRV